ncbi:actin-like ATPase domain-containing protein [Aspergillus sclerotiicarbonarius CBS 121057]|uniref:Actin-like ATPase domain-containing protein n=1 Tax=Aspergillus sclerotiicarbonarius (strain CBS 121057 / IBT 28362) TaxID=1448318 RepID=A0A319EHZ2_ASPSB|nr:actin-like ATPase domain-containing protein [Aspergillus sclerotiicarbonarius CBS 121057]
MNPTLFANITIGLDFGTTYSGVAFTTSGIPHVPDATTHVSQWPGNKELMSGEKTPTLLQRGRANNWGRNWGAMVEPGMDASAWFKLKLEDGLETSEYDDPVLNDQICRGIFNLPTNRTAAEASEEFLRRVYRHAWQRLRHVTQGAIDRLPVTINVTVPAVWKEPTQALTERIVRAAGFGQRNGDQVVIIPEPVAAAVWVFKNRGRDLAVSDAFVICDIGGGTIDVASFYVRQIYPRPGIVQLGASRAGKCGTTAVDSRFYQLMERRFPEVFRAQPLDVRGPGSPLMRSFHQCIEDFRESHRPCREYRFEFPMTVPDANPLYYDTQESQIILYKEDVLELLNPIVQSTRELLYSQEAFVASSCSGRKHLFLVGGGACIPYINQSIEKESDGVNVEVPTQPYHAVVLGAAMYGTENDHLTIHMCPQHVGFACTRTYDAQRDGQAERGLVNPRLDYFTQSTIADGVASWSLTKASLSLLFFSFIFFSFLSVCCSCFLLYDC